MGYGDKKLPLHAQPHLDIREVVRFEDYERDRLFIGGIKS